MLKRLMGYFGDKTWALAVSMLFTIAAAATEVGLVSQIQPLIDNVFSSKNTLFVWLVPFVVVAAFTVRGLLTFVSTYINQWLLQNALVSLRSDIFAKLLHLPDATFKQERSSAMLAKFTTDSSNALSSLTELIMVAVREGALVIGIMGYLLWLNWRLTLVVMVTLPIAGFVARMFSKRLRTIAQLTQDSNALMIGSVKEAVAAQRMVKVHEAYGFESQRFASLIAKLRRLGMRSTVAAAATAPVTQIIASFGVGIVIALAIYQSQIATPGQLVTAGVFTGIISSMVHLFQPLKQLANMNGAYARTQAAAASVFEFLDQPDERQDTGTQPMPTGELTITVEKLSVHYAGSDVAALNDVSFTLAAGKTTTLLGRSGSGKSTFAALLPRLIDPSQGRVCINRIDIKTIRLSELRHAISMVTQEATLVDDTVAANVAYGEAEPDEARLWAALEAASMAGTVRDLPSGLHTMVGEGGSRFSGGQRQRLTIARAFYKNAPILILDEATSALDVESEAHIQLALKALMVGRTTLVITHRLNTIVSNSHIVLLEAGKIIEQGSTAVLMAQQGAFAQLIQSNDTA
jgi:ATP-binding cassette, subfamily B, bacterial MsbA